MPLCELRSEPLAETQLLHFPPFDSIPGFAHAVTTRPWNMATHRGPEANLAVDRRRQLCMHLGLPFERLTAADQVHSPHVIRVRESDAGAGRDGRETALRFVDGLACDLANTPLMQFSADCPLILVAEPNRRLFGMAHASWRGTVTGIAGELIRQLRVEFSVDPAKLIAGVCPCAGPEEYEVGEEVLRIACSLLVREKICVQGDAFAIVAGWPPSGGSNTVKLHRL